MPTKAKMLLPGCEMKQSITAYMHGISFTRQSGVIWSFPGATRWFYLYSTPVRISAQNTYSFCWTHGLSDMSLKPSNTFWMEMLWVSPLKKKLSCFELCDSLLWRTGRRKSVKRSSRIPQADWDTSSRTLQTSSTCYYIHICRYSEM